MKKMVIHLETQIRTLVGIVDDQGNVVEKFALVPNEGNPIQKFSGDEFLKAFSGISALKAEVERKVREEECSTTLGE